MVNLKNIVLLLSIAIIFSLFSIYTTNIFIPQPKYNNFCNETYPSPALPLKKCNLTLQDEIQTGMNKCYEEGKVVINRVYKDGCIVDFECSDCLQLYQKAEENWNKKYFLYNTLLGLIGIIIASLFSIEVVSGGLIGGGASIILFSSARAWTSLPDFLRVALLGLVLIILIYIAIKTSKTSARKSKNRKR